MTFFNVLKQFSQNLNFLLQILKIKYWLSYRLPIINIFKYTSIYFFLKIFKIFIFQIKKSEELPTLYFIPTS